MIMIWKLDTVTKILGPKKFSYFNFRGLWITSSSPCWSNMGEVGRGGDYHQKGKVIFNTSNVIWHYFMMLHPVHYNVKTTFEKKIVVIIRNWPLARLRYMIRYTVPNIHDVDECFTVVDLIKWSTTTHQHEQDDSKTPNVFKKTISNM